MCSHQAKFILLTMSSSCSFRITRTAEDLAQTITALSQRLVKLEKRQEALELQISSNPQDPPAEEMARLDGVEQLLRDCQELLDSSDQQEKSDQTWTDESEHLAA